MRVLLLSLVTSVAIGCATGQPGATSASLSDTVRGPGAVFTNVDEAAVDALTWCYLQSRTPLEQRSMGTSRVRGGTIWPTEGGYTYGPVSVAPERDASRVEFPMRPGDVAHFRHYPPLGNFRADRINETLSAADRSIVDTVDPLGRPAYLLTPSRNVRVYTGGDTEHHVASLRDGMRRGMMASR